MKNSNTFLHIFKQLISENDINLICERHQYIDKARKFSVFNLINFFSLASLNQWKSFRHSCNVQDSFHYSTVSKKAKDVPFAIAKDLFQLILSRMNRSMIRKSKLPKTLLAIDSTTITLGENRLPWARFHGKRSGIKLHVAIENSTTMPVNVEESVALTHDSLMLQDLIDPTCIIVADRGYFQITRSDKFKETKQDFVIRMKSNIQIAYARPLKRAVSETVEASNIVGDYSCLVGTTQNRSKLRHRIVEFIDYEGKTIRVITNLYNLSSETIAQIYKDRWAIETFFKWLKQHLNLSTIFGTSKNSVYTQLYTALLTHVILNGVYRILNKRISYKKLSLLEFARKLSADKLDFEWHYFLDDSINFILSNYG